MQKILRMMLVVSFSVVSLSCFGMHPWEICKGEVLEFCAAKSDGSVLDDMRSFFDDQKRLCPSIARNLIAFFMHHFSEIRNRIAELERTKSELEEELNHINLGLDERTSEFEKLTEKHCDMERSLNRAMREAEKAQPGRSISNCNELVLAIKAMNVIIEAMNAEIKEYNNMFKRITTGLLVPPGDNVSGLPSSAGSAPDAVGSVEEGLAVDASVSAGSAPGFVEDDLVAAVIVPDEIDAVEDDLMVDVVMSDGDDDGRRRIGRERLFEKRKKT